MNRNYRIKDALEILEITRDKLFYWIKFQRLTIPEVQGEGKGTRSKLSILNIIELSIAKELANIGIELAFVRKILETIVSSYEPETTVGSFKIEDKSGKRKTKKPTSRVKLSKFVYDEYRDRQRDYPNFYFLIFKNEKGKYQFRPLWYVRVINLESIMKMSNTMVIVNIFEILQTIENKLGEKL